MSITSNRKVQRLIKTGAALVIMGTGLNVLVTQTLGAFTAASVVLALYVGLWAYALGSLLLIALSLWLFLTRKSWASDPIHVKPDSEVGDVPASGSLERWRKSSGPTSPCVPFTVGVPNEEAGLWRSF